MNSKFSLAFGIAISVVGFFCIFFDLNNGVMLGLSTSALVFSIINIFSIWNNKEWFDYFYIFPFAILLIFSCFGENVMENDFILFISSKRITNVVSFISFGLIFISEFFNNKSKNVLIIEQMHNNIKNDILFFKSLAPHFEKMTNGKSFEERKEFRPLLNEVMNKMYKDELKLDLLENNKNTFTLKELDELINESEMVNYAEIEMDALSKNKKRK